MLKFFLLIYIKYVKMQEKQFDKIRGIFSTQKKHLIQIFKTILQIIKHLLKKNIINKET